MREEFISINSRLGGGRGNFLSRAAFARSFQYLWNLSSHGDFAIVKTGILVLKYLVPAFPNALDKPPTLLVVHGQTFFLKNGKII